MVVVAADGVEVGDREMWADVVIAEECGADAILAGGEVAADGDIHIGEAIIR